MGTNYERLLGAHTDDDDAWSSLPGDGSKHVHKEELSGLWLFVERCRALHVRKDAYFIGSIFWLVGTAALLFSAVLLHSRPGVVVSPNAQLVYSPAQDAISYQEVVFFNGFKDDTVYKGPPSPELDKAWGDLYQFGISQITKEEAVQLPNQTSKVPGDESSYIVGLDVFHQLHCLNRIRKLFWPEYYETSLHEGSEGQDESFEHYHLDHCIEYLRQAIMCHSDVSTVYWQWSKERNKTLADAHVTHSCRNFDAIKEWAQEHHLQTPFDEDTYVPGSPIQ